MKIVIIGPSGSGKTTLAADISKRLRTSYITSESIVFDFSNKHKGRRSVQEIKSETKRFLRKESWIFEGVHVIPSILESSEIVIVIKPSLVTALYNQWKRYLTDPTQREKYGFYSNLRLSLKIINNQYLGWFVPKRFSLTDGHKVRLEKYLKKHESKVIKVTSIHDDRVLEMLFN